MTSMAGLIYGVWLSYVLNQFEIVYSASNTVFGTGLTADSWVTSKLALDANKYSCPAFSPIMVYCPKKGPGKMPGPRMSHS